MSVQHDRRKNEKSAQKKKYEVLSPKLSSDVFLIIGPKPVVSVFQTLLTIYNYFRPVATQ